MNTNPIFLGLFALPLLASPIVYLIGRFSARKNKRAGMVIAQVVTLLVLIADAFLLYKNVQTATSAGGIAVQIGTVSLMFDGVGLTLSAVVLFLGFFVTLFSVPYMAREKGEEKFFALLLITIGSIIGLGLSYDLFNLWVWFEAMAVSTYLLVAFYNEQPASLEAGIKYLVQSAIGSALVLFGIAIIFSQAGATDFETIWKLGAAGGPIVIIAGVLMIVGFGVKAALVPLHTWLPDAHSQAPSGISAMLSGVVIEAGLVAMLRTISMMGKLGENWGAVLLGFGCLNILVGNLMALRQKEVKRLLAYSSLAHVGYMLLGFGFALMYGLGVGAMGGFFHLITHSMMKGLAFLAAGSLLYALHLAKGDHGALMLDDLNGASRKFPVIAVALSAAVLGLGGLPPFAGFMSKWQILLAGVASKNVWMLVIVIFAALNSVLSLAYYAPIVNRLFKREMSESVSSAEPIHWAMTIPVIVLTIGILVLGIWPSLADFFTQKAALGMFWFYFN
jgi:proton-translocating NADH-quinone oxidoreductase chain N